MSAGYILHIVAAVIKLSRKSIVAAWLRQCGMACEENGVASKAAKPAAKWLG